MKVAVVGAGLAGLVAALELCERGHAVVLFEKRPWAGGRTYSYDDRDSGAELDNGQHVFMRCTTAYRWLLRKLGTEPLTELQPRLEALVFDERGRPATLAADPLPAPFHLARSFARYRHLSVGERLSAARALAKVWRMSEPARLSLADRSFADWLTEHGQGGRARRALWDFVVLPTLNCTAEEASAADALFVFRRALLQRADAAGIGVPRVGLSRLHVEPALERLRRRGAEVRLRTGIARVELDGDAVAGVVTARGRAVPVDALVLAVGHEALPWLLPEHPSLAPIARAAARLTSSPIVNVHLWFDRPVLRFRFAASLRRDLQWVFDRSAFELCRRGSEQHVVVSLSGAREEVEMRRDVLRDRTLAALETLPAASRGARLVRYAVAKEPWATFVPAPGAERPPIATPIRNLVLAGAHTDTGWPATMESAVRSGILAARLLHSRMGAIRRSQDGEPEV